MVRRQRAPKGIVLNAMLVSASVLSLSVIPLGCGADDGPVPEDQQGLSGSSGASAGPGGGGSSGSGGSGPDLTVDPAPQAGSSTVGAPCAEDIYSAQPVPVDVMLLIDSSSSMNELVGQNRKWDLAREALLDFAQDPRSAGLGLGVQFFPQPGGGSPCFGEAGCGFPVLGPTPAACQPTRYCSGVGNPEDGFQRCGARSADCPGNSACVPAGRCSASALDCTEIGEPCASDIDGDHCDALPNRCDTTSGEGGCQIAAYEAPPVPISTLPVPGQRRIARSMSERGPSGGTPMEPAVRATLAYLAEHQAAFPERRTILVLATDGHPSGCSGAGIPGIAELLAAAPNLTTYLIGVFPAEDDEGAAAVTELAMAGGGGPPFIVTPADDFAEQFLSALDEIRGRALPCEFSIPELPSIDFGKVNMHYTGSAGEQTILYTAGPAGCDSTTGGWYYDSDPAMGRPARVVVCDATCQMFKTDPNPSVELGFGCTTVVK